MPRLLRWAIREGAINTLGIEHNVLGLFAHLRAATEMRDRPWSDARPSGQGRTGGQARAPHTSVTVESTPTTRNHTESHC